ncbi:MAG: response regulator [Spirochaetales bacterium]|nr:response regulator [Spirochaetales bacterium]
MPRKSVLLIDESDLFRDYLKSRLTQAGIGVETAINGLDGIAKMRNEPPDAVVMDYHLSRKSCVEVLEEKSRNPNTAPVSVILTAQKIDKNRLLELVRFNIRKVFMKPIKMDAFYQILGDILGVRIDMDATPCIVEAHVNDNILFIEVARGINREKIDLLRFKIRELLDLYGIQKPRIMIMLSDMELSFVDGPNLEFLLNTIIASPGAKHRNIKILTRSAFVKEFVSGRPEFSELEVVSSLEYALDGLVADAALAADAPEDKAAIISDRILTPQREQAGAEAVTMRFDVEKRPAELTEDAARRLGADLEIAVVDDDFVIQELLKTTFSTINARVTTFRDGRDFLDAVSGRVFDLVFLDLRMPEVDGFGVLKELHAQDLDMPIIVLSAVTQREAVVRAFQAGVKSYLIKPLKPEQILRKTLEILKANF